MALASDRDREATTSALRRHYVGGRLSLDDLDGRLETALGASRQQDLASTLEDLPPVWRDRDELQRIGRAATVVVKRGLFLSALAAGWLTMNVLLLVAFVIVAVLRGPTPLEEALLALAWIATTLVAIRMARHR